MDLIIVKLGTERRSDKPYLFEVRHITTYWYRDLSTTAKKAAEKKREFCLAMESEKHCSRGTLARCNE